MSLELIKENGLRGGHRSGLPPGLRPSVFVPASLRSSRGDLWRGYMGVGCAFLVFVAVVFPPPHQSRTKIFFIVGAVREGCPFPLSRLIVDDSGRLCWCNSPAASPRLGGGSAAEGCRHVPLQIAAPSRSRWPPMSPQVAAPGCRPVPPRGGRWRGGWPLATVAGGGRARSARSRSNARSLVRAGLPFWASIRLIWSIF